MRGLWGNPRRDGNRLPCDGRVASLSPVPGPVDGWIHLPWPVISSVITLQGSVPKKKPRGQGVQKAASWRAGGGLGREVRPSPHLVLYISPSRVPELHPVLVHRDLGSNVLPELRELLWQMIGSRGREGGRGPSSVYTAGGLPAQVTSRTGHGCLQFQDGGLVGRSPLPGAFCPTSCYRPSGRSSPRGYFPRFQAL